MKQNPNERSFELSSTEMSALAKVGRALQVAKGDEIFGVGDDPDTLWLVKEGRVHMTITSSAGLDSLLSYYGPGQSFCAAANIVGKPYPCTARAAVDTELVAIPGAAFKKLFD